MRRLHRKLRSSLSSSKESKRNKNNDGDNNNGDNGNEGGSGYDKNKNYDNEHYEERIELQSQSQSQSQPSVIGTSVSSKANSPDDCIRSRSRGQSRVRNSNSNSHGHDNSRIHSHSHNSHRSEISLSRLYTMDTDLGTSVGIGSSTPSSLDFSSMISSSSSSSLSSLFSTDKKGGKGDGGVSLSTSVSASTSTSKFTSGSSLDQDSFVVMSTAGLSSIGSSLNSFYSYDPFTGRYGGGNANVNGHRTGNDNSSGEYDDNHGNHDDDNDDDDDDDEIEIMKLTGNISSNSQGQMNNMQEKNNNNASSSKKQYQNYQHHYLHARKTTKRLPRLTGSTAQDKAFFSIINRNSNHQKTGGGGGGSSSETTSYSSNDRRNKQLSYKKVGSCSIPNSGSPDSIIGTAPTTPINANNKNNGNTNLHNFPRHGHGHDENDENDNERKSVEFPVSPMNTTPQFHIPGHTTTHRHAGAHGHYNNENNCRSISSSRRHASLLSSSTSYCTTNCSTSYNSEKAMTKEHKIMSAAIAEKEFWMKKLRNTVVQYGKESVETARQLNNLGSALLRCKEHSEALSVYKKMIGVLRRNFDDDSLVYARALDKVGLAASMCPTQQNLEWALLALNEALHVRLTQLGPHHCDTVDTLNNIAGVFLHMKEWAKAKDAYVDVLTVRAAIFGNNHPSIAVTAQTLGKVCSHLSDFEGSLKYFELALFIYRGEPMMLNDSHPLIKRTMRNIDRTERLMVTLGISLLAK